MSWKQVLMDAGLSERESDAVIILSSNDRLRASELAKELGTTRLDAYNSLSRLQEMGIVLVSAEKPMKFSCESLDIVIKKLIEMQRTMLKRTEEGLAELEGTITDSATKPSSKKDSLEPRFAVLKERTNIFNKIKKMAIDAEEGLVLLLGQFGICLLYTSDAADE